MEKSLWSHWVPLPTSPCEANIYGDPEAADIVFTCEADVLAIGLNAIELDPAFTKNIGQIVLLGGAFLVNGNVNPASEANIFGDPEAADIVFTCGADVGYWAQCYSSNHDRDILAESDGIFAKYLSKILEFYFSYHRDAYNMKGVYLHDPTTILAAVNPSLMTYMEGVIRVQTTGITRGLSLFFNKQKRFNEETEWCNKPTVKVAVTVDAPEVVKLVMQRLMY
ncbi:putative inosine/uridine-preferring nucleoside hydrolase domain, ribonucleoside hydrolase [Helianthus annuus]|nr:putative inosine/uridine-preferring nucleoside hydrolase domain, ribonucleoside hydrolase [Helianthus annuus]